MRPTHTDMTLFKALTDSIRDTGASKIVVEDPLTGALSGRKVLLGARISRRQDRRHDETRKAKRRPDAA